MDVMVNCGVINMRKKQSKYKTYGGENNN